MDTAVSLILIVATTVATYARVLVVPYADGPMDVSRDHSDTWRSLKKRATGATHRAAEARNPYPESLEMNRRDGVHLYPDYINLRTQTSRKPDKTHSRPDEPDSGHNRCIPCVELSQPAAIERS